MTGLGPSVPTFLSLLIAVTLVAALVRQTRLPYEVALVLAGLVMAILPGVPHVQITPEVILTVFLPVLLFHGAYNLSLTDLRATLRLVSFLALPGVAATAALVGLALHLLAGMPWLTALLFGAIVGATDPVSVLAIFGKVNAPRRLSTVVNAESLFNDGTALVLFSILLGIATRGQFSAVDSALQLIVVIAGSSLLGAAVGLAGAVALSRVDDALVEISITLIMAYGGYLLAAAIGLSGPLATVAAGLLFATRGQQVMSPNTRLQAQAIWEFLDFLANSLLFLLMGLAVRGAAMAPGGRIGPALITPLLIALLAVVLSRVVVVVLTDHMLTAVGRPLPRGWAPVLVWAGLRGAVSLAAALSLPTGLADRELLVVLTFGVVLFTLLAQGLTIAPLLSRLGLADEPPIVEQPTEPSALRRGTGAIGAAESEIAFSNALTDEDLAGRLGISTAVLAMLRRAPPLDPANPGDRLRIAALARRLGTDRSLLAQVLENWQTEGLSWALRTYRQRYGLSDTDLASYLQMPESKLDALYHSPHPNPARGDYDRQLAQLAEAADGNVDRLGALLADVAQQDVQSARQRLPHPAQEPPWASES
jgi:CPA1 family monovalent cation:H+ antiporter